MHSRSLLKSNSQMTGDITFVVYMCLIYIEVLVTLRYVAKADFFSEVGDLHSISRSSVCRIIHNGISLSSIFSSMID